MSRRKKLAKGLAHAVAPKLTFSALNPGKAAFAKAASWTMDHAMPRRRRSRTSTAMKGVGAAALALPLGVWLGRRFLDPRPEEGIGGHS